MGQNCPKRVEINDGVLKPSVSNVRFSGLIRPKKTKKSTSIQPAAEDEIRGRSRRTLRAPISGRGMSPASNDEADDVAPSPLKRKVVAAQPHNAQTQQNPRSVSSFAMCLNPW
ncbi:hypothetical protein KSP40_PGU018814 [Platanthera guangdongensis]|uniref:Uncharacterized protein n=1 Tax=Platanthera guangdongensis TaxID=2320717 RepID=A0ABR2MLY4_9ASPA